MASRAFSSEVETGSREENATQQKPRSQFRCKRNGDGDKRRIGSLPLTALAAVVTAVAFSGGLGGLARAEESEIYEQGGKCLKYLPGIGRMTEVPCASAAKPEPDAKPAPEETTPPPPESTNTSSDAGTPAEIVVPERGTPLRADLMNAVRPVFERETGGSILFQVRRIAVYGDWAFGNVHPTRTTGADIDWSATKFADDLKAGAFEADTSFFLLRKENGAWKVVETAIGPTDVAWDSWRQQYNLPPGLFTQ